MPKAGVRRVAVIGAGYVGLPTAVVLSHHGHLVTIAEHDDRRYDALCQGRSPIVEHGLDEMLKDGLSTGPRAPSSCSCAWRRRRPTTGPPTSRA